MSIVMDAAAKISVLEVAEKSSMQASDSNNNNDDDDAYNEGRVQLIGTQNSAVGDTTERQGEPKVYENKTARADREHQELVASGVKLKKKKSLMNAIIRYWTVFCCTVVLLFYPFTAITLFLASDVVGRSFIVLVAHPVLMEVSERSERRNKDAQARLVSKLASQFPFFS